ncbi:MAG TPA: efflux RND transporter periplasmic adaptor subunit [Bryobacteraceae bacterium]|nr:efflux RND transporter periplasmic adaptor subunit [Bryobacteraceae bacterium]
MKKLLLVLLLVVVAVIAWGVFRRTTPPSVTFARVKRETLVSTLPTNGKAEPFEWQPVRSETEGLVSRLNVAEGQAVTKGAVMAVLSDPAKQADVDTAQAKLSEAEANLASLEAGPKPAELTEIDNAAARASLDLQAADRELATSQRLAEKQAATTAEVTAARDKVNQIKALIAGLDKRRRDATPQTDIAAARARVEDARVALKLAQQQAAQGEIHAPLSGVVYGLAVRPGAYLNPGDLVANVGELDRLRVRVYVDEPELGRIALGQPVTITWQGLPDKQWNGTVERKPSDIEALGSRQVGQVICVIENPGHLLIPGTNVDATIRTAVVENALTIPKEAVRHDPGGDYVFVLKGDTFERCGVKAGASSITRLQILTGLSEGDAVAMPSDVALKPGMKITPAIEAR